MSHQSQINEPILAQTSLETGNLPVTIPTHLFGRVMEAVTQALPEARGCVVATINATLDQPQTLGGAVDASHRVSEGVTRNLSVDEGPPSPADSSHNELVWTPDRRSCASGFRARVSTNKITISEVGNDGLWGNFPIQVMAEVEGTAFELRLEPQKYEWPLFYSIFRPGGQEREGFVLVTLDALNRIEPWSVAMHRERNLSDGESIGIIEALAGWREPFVLPAPHKSRSCYLQVDVAPIIEALNAKNPSEISSRGMEFLKEAWAQANEYDRYRMLVGRCVPRGHRDEGKTLRNEYEPYVDDFLMNALLDHNYEIRRKVVEINHWRGHDRLIPLPYLLEHLESPGPLVPSADQKAYRNKRLAIAIAILDTASRPGCPDLSPDHYEVVRRNPRFYVYLEEARRFLAQEMDSAVRNLSEPAELSRFVGEIRKDPALAIGAPRKLHLWEVVIEEIVIDEMNKMSEPPVRRGYEFLINTMNWAFEKLPPSNKQNIDTLIAKVRAEVRASSLPERKRP